MPLPTPGRSTLVGGVWFQQSSPTATKAARAYATSPRTGLSYEPSASVPGADFWPFLSAPVYWNRHDLSDVLRSSAGVPKSAGPSS
jgi:hypothetical protein